MKNLYFKLFFLSFASLALILSTINQSYAGKNTSKKNAKIIFTGSALGAIEPCG